MRHTQNWVKNLQFQESIEDVFIQVELRIKDVLYGFMFHLRALVLPQLCTKLGHMLFNHCFPVVCFCFIITVSYVYGHYVGYF